MPRSSPGVVLVAVLTACTSAPPAVDPLDVRDVVAAPYEGSIRTVEASDEGDQGSVAVAAPRSTAGATSGRALACRATWLELTREQAREFVPALAAPPPPERQSLRSGERRLWTRSHFYAEGGESHVSKSPRLHALGTALGHVDPAALRTALKQLAAARRVVTTAEARLVVGAPSEIEIEKQRAFVRSLRLGSVADSFVVSDVEVGTLAYGTTLHLSVHERDAEFVLELAWEQRTPVLPHAVATTFHGAIEIPALACHRIAVSTPLAPRDALVVAALPGSTPEHLRVLCLELEGVREAG